MQVQAQVESLADLASQRGDAAGREAERFAARIERGAAVVHLYTSSISLFMYSLKVGAYASSEVECTGAWQPMSVRSRTASQRKSAEVENQMWRGLLTSHEL